MCRPQDLRQDATPAAQPDPASLSLQRPAASPGGRTASLIASALSVRSHCLRASRAPRVPAHRQGSRPRARDRRPHRLGRPARRAERAADHLRAHRLRQPDPSADPLRPVRTRDLQHRHRGTSRTGPAAPSPSRRPGRRPPVKHPDPGRARPADADARTRGPRTGGLRRNPHSADPAGPARPSPQPAVSLPPIAAP
jgi:hypothetical protein